MFVFVLKVEEEKVIRYSYSRRRIHREPPCVTRGAGDRPEGIAPSTPSPSLPSKSCRTLEGVESALPGVPATHRQHGWSGLQFQQGCCEPLRTACWRPLPPAAACIQPRGCRSWSAVYSGLSEAPCGARPVQRLRKLAMPAHYPLILSSDMCHRWGRGGWTAGCWQPTSSACVAQPHQHAGAILNPVCLQRWPFAARP